MFTQKKWHDKIKQYVKIQTNRGSYMLWFTKLEQKYGKYAIPNLTLYLIVCYAIGYLLQLSANYNPAISNLIGYLTLDIYAVLHGQVWRIVTWLLIPPGSFDLFTLVMLYCYFSIGTLLERTWGTFRYNVFMFMGIIFTLLGAVILYIITFFIGSGSGALAAGIDYMSVTSSWYSYMFSTYYISMSIFFGICHHISGFPDVIYVCYSDQGKGAWYFLCTDHGLYDLYGFFIQRILRNCQRNRYFVLFAQCSCVLYYYKKKLPDAGTDEETERIPQKDNSTKEHHKAQMCDLRTYRGNGSG